MNQNCVATSLTSFFYTSVVVKLRTSEIFIYNAKESVEEYLFSGGQYNSTKTKKRQ